MTKIGSTKTIRNGYEVSFRKATPTATYNAIKRELKKRGFEVEDEHKANTGSRYLEMSNGTMSIEVRCSDHTYGLCEKSGLAVHHSWRSSGNIWGLELDLAWLDINAADFRNMMAEIDNINEHHLLEGVTADNLDAFDGATGVLLEAIKTSVKEVENYRR